MYQKNFLNIVLLVLVAVIVIIAGCFILTKESRSLQGNVTQQDSTTEVSLSSQNSTVSTPLGTQVLPSDSSQVVDHGLVTQVVENDAVRQPVYLVSAYLKDSVGYVDVDYIEMPVDSIKAQVEDGKCPNEEECYAFPNGYKRNRNPKIRTLAVSPNVLIEVNGVTAFELSKEMGNGLLVSFENFVDIVSGMLSYYPQEKPFKDAKTFVTIDVKDNIVTNITEPYQE